ncbi:MAG: hypothetical protein M3Y88_02570 [Chloroflexota bacterium]|nr:hypothetical protein [Chloroflexota bacterium]
MSDGVGVKLGVTATTGVGATARVGVAGDGVAAAGVTRPVGEGVFVGGPVLITSWGLLALLREPIVSPSLLLMLNRKLSAPFPATARETSASTQTPGFAGGRVPAVTPLGGAVFQVTDVSVQEPPVSETVVVAALASVT